LKTARARCTVGSMVVKHLIFAVDICALGLATVVFSTFVIYVVVMLLNMKPF